MQLTGAAHPRFFTGRAFAVAFASALAAGCFDGRLDSFEIAGPRGGQSGVAGGTSGTGGAAGAATNGGSAGAPAALLLDDFEDQNNAVEPDGWWYANDDRTGPPATMTFDAVTGRGVSRFGVHLGSGPTVGYGSFLGLDLPGGLFDATGFAALSFWARLEPAGELSVRFQNSQGTQYEQVRTLDGTWREVRLPLADFRSNTDDTTFDLTDVTHLQFWLAGERPKLDLYVDDVWLLRNP